MSMNGISIIICCYNSERTIGETLRTIVNQKSIENIPTEIIVVDNNSTDSTFNIVNDFIKINPLISIVREKKQGLSHARIRGYKTSQYDYLLYCDDDNFLVEDYISNAYHIISTNKNIGALGGIGSPLFEIEPEKRILPYIEQYAVGKQANKSLDDITFSKGYVYGAGAVFNKEALDYIFFNGFQFNSLGRNGKSLTGGEDIELCNAIRLAGYRIVYNESLKFKHYLTKERLNWQYLKRMNFGSGLTIPLTIGYSLINEFKFKQNVLWIIILAIKNILSILLKLTYRKNDSLFLKFEIAKGFLLSSFININNSKAALKRVLSYSQNINNKKPLS
nr:glycosyltransferase [uncultured Carboxylicivirga sp.]